MLVASAWYGAWHTIGVLRQWSPISEAAPSNPHFQIVWPHAVVFLAETLLAKNGQSEETTVYFQDQIIKVIVAPPLVSWAGFPRWKLRYQISELSFFYEYMHSVLHISSKLCLYHISHILICCTYISFSEKHFSQVSFRFEYFFNVLFNLKIFRDIPAIFQFSLLRSPFWGWQVAQ
jgi:hypothetical protein